MGVLADGLADQLESRRAGRCSEHLPASSNGAGRFGRVRSTAHHSMTAGSPSHWLEHRRTSGKSNIKLLRIAFDSPLAGLFSLLLQLIFVAPSSEKSSKNRPHFSPQEHQSVDEIGRSEADGVAKPAIRVRTGETWQLSCYSAGNIVIVFHFQSTVYPSD